MSFLGQINKNDPPISTVSTDRFFEQKNVLGLPCHNRVGNDSVDRESFLLKWLNNDSMRSDFLYNIWSHKDFHPFKNVYTSEQYIIDNPTAIIVRLSSWPGYITVTADTNLDYKHMRFEIIEGKIMYKGRSLLFDEFIEYINDLKDTECVICLEPATESPVHTNCCGTRFHKKCLETHINIKKTCPICRIPLLAIPKQDLLTIINKQSRVSPYGCSAN